MKIFRKIKKFFHKIREWFKVEDIGLMPSIKEVEEFVKFNIQEYYSEDQITEHILRAYQLVHYKSSGSITNPHYIHNEVLRLTYVSIVNSLKRDGILGANIL